MPTDRFVLEYGHSTYGNPHCRDSEKTRRVEDRINDLVIRWVEELGRQRADRRAREEAERRRAEEERARSEREAELLRQRQELHGRQQAEWSRVDGLLADATAWERSRAVRAYLDEVERTAVARGGAIEPGGELARWLAWARRQADRLDPFTPSPPSVLDERI